MTVEEIKQSITMTDLLARYGVKVRNKMCCCPIHKEKHPSMQVFKDGYYCYACGSHGDIFNFIQEMESCDFKSAFISLGGTYAEYSTDKQKKLTQKKFQRQKEARQRQVDFETSFMQMFSNAISKCRMTIRNEEPYTDRWCICIDALDWLLHTWEEKYIREGEINRADVIRLCKRIERA